MDTNKTIAAYLTELSSSSPTPGGGNVAALCGSLASSLGVMVCNLTVGKKKYIDVEAEIKEILNEISSFSDTFVTLAQDDNAAFDAVMDAFKLPKETDEQKKHRHDMIESATLGAAAVPASVIANCSLLLPFLSRIAEIGNQNSLSDAAVAIALVRTAAEGAYLNVLINCSALADAEKYSDLLKTASSAYDTIQMDASVTVQSIIQKLQPAAI